MVSMAFPPDAPEPSKRSRRNATEGMELRKLGIFRGGGPGVGIPSSGPPLRNKMATTFCLLASSPVGQRRFCLSRRCTAKPQSRGGK